MLAIRIFNGFCPEMVIRKTGQRHLLAIILDGNKRPAFAAAIVFWDLNGVSSETLGRLYEIIIDITTGKATKQDADRVLKGLAK